MYRNEQEQEESFPVLRDGIPIHSKYLLFPLINPLYYQASRISLFYLSFLSSPFFLSYPFFRNRSTTLFVVVVQTLLIIY